MSPLQLVSKSEERGNVTGLKFETRTPIGRSLLFLFCVGWRKGLLITAENLFALDFKIAHFEKNYGLD